MSRVAIILSPGFADWEYAFIAGIGGPFYGLDIRFFAVGARPLVSQGGLQVGGTDDLDALIPWQPAVVVIVGGMGWESEQAPDIGALLEVCHAQGIVLAGICGGTLALARSGRLDRCRHTSNDASFLTDKAEGYRGQAGYVESAVAVVDNGVITAPGTAPTSFAAAVFDAAGLPATTVAQFRAMLAAEHR